MYIESVKTNFFTAEELEMVEVKHEVPEEESEEFLQLL